MFKIFAKKGRLQNGRKYDIDYMQKLAEEYDEFRNASEISLREGINKNTLYYNFRILKLNKPKRTIEMNEEYFKKINTEAKSYLLGFIMADGCVSRTSKTNPRANRLIVNISSKDRYLLELLKKELGCGYEIKDRSPKRTYSENTMSSLSVNSIKLCDDLQSYGIVERKTGKERLPVLPENMYRHFIRGFLDGDGFITKTKYVTTIGFVSNDDMLKDLKDRLSKDLGLEGVANIIPDAREKPVSYLRYSKKEDIAKLKKYLYKNAHFYLQRKYSKLTK